MTTGRPTWAGPPRVLAADPGARTPDAAARTRGERAPAALVAAVVGMVGLAGYEVVHVAGRDDLLPAMRGFLLVVLALQVPVALLALRRSTAAAMLLLLCAVTALVASVAGGLGTTRAYPAVAAAAVVALLGRSLRWFPTYELP